MGTDNRLAEMNFHSVNPRSLSGLCIKYLLIVGLGVEFGYS
ncbi:hypothetical protein Metme_0243 [Methylomonas methanica MC09]|uniref:Uncharacterized protein n=1 Tax=Methylomonas methanica (strain DSM 25384 / MC09) TaxID=857087 RepID=F9ZZN3_METMM|nr:hypothetical protein Metme_0243 [Methylomonas methanica MC09]